MYLHSWIEHKCYTCESAKAFVLEHTSFTVNQALAAVSREPVTEVLSCLHKLAAVKLPQSSLTFLDPCIFKAEAGEVSSYGLLCV